MQRPHHLARSSVFSGTHLHPFEEQSAHKTSRAPPMSAGSPLAASAPVQHPRQSLKQLRPPGPEQQKPFRKQQTPTASTIARSEHRGSAVAEAEPCRPGSSASQS